MAAMFLTATGVAVREAVQKAGSYSIECAFQWLDSPISQQLLPSQIWRDALAGPAAERLKQDQELSPSRFSFCAWLIPPKILRSIIYPTRQDVQKLAVQPLDDLPLPLRLPTAFVLVTLGLQAEGSLGVKLLKQGFFRVYDALASNEYAYPPECWSLLAPELPHSPPWKEWDRCKKLRRAVRKKVLHCMERDNLLKLADNPERRSVVNDLYGDEPEDDEFLD